jgi:hypothetical protein
VFHDLIRYNDVKKPGRVRPIRVNGVCIRSSQSMTAGTQFSSHPESAILVLVVRYEELQAAAAECGGFMFGDCLVALLAGQRYGPFSRKHWSS